METEQHSPKNQMTGAFELFEPSIKAIGLNIGTIVFLILSIIAVLIVPVLLLVAATSFGNGASWDNNSPILAGAAILVAIVSIAAAIVLVASFISVGLHGVRGKKISFDEAVQSGKNNALRLVGLGIVTGLIILAGLILLIVPGIFMYKRYILAPYYVVDKDLGVFEAMRQSAADSKTFSGPVWGLIGVVILLNVAGIIPILGIFISVASLLYSFAPAKRYDEIQKALGHKSSAHAVAG